MTARRERLRPAAGLLGLGLVTMMIGCSPQRPDVSCRTDPGAIRAADLAYATAWIANDPDRVMATLTDGAVIVPSGIPPLQGAPAIRAFWWPPGSPVTTVLEFELDQREAAGETRIAFVRGSFELRFLYGGKEFPSSGDYLSILQCQRDGSWRISHRQWSDHPPPAD